jgi:hypothetical protein
MILYRVFPSRAIALIVLIGLIDLVSTAWLHATGQIVEMNPVMRIFIDKSEWLFVLVKGLTLVLGWMLLVHHAKVNKVFVRRACLLGSVAYMGIWLVWFVHGS